MFGERDMLSAGKEIPLIFHNQQHQGIQRQIPYPYNNLIHSKRCRNKSPIKTTKQPDAQTLP